MALLFNSIIAPVLLLAAPVLQFPPLDGAPGAAGDGDARRLSIAAAANEREHIRVLFQNDETARTITGISVDWVGAIQAPVTAWRIEPNPGTPPSGLRGTEPLSVVIGSLDVPPGGALDLVLAVHVAEDAQAGNYLGTLKFAFDAGKPVTWPIQLEIFDFTLPGVPSLPVLFGIDQRTPRAAGISSGALDHWAPSYDALAGLRAGFSVWPVERARPDVFYDYSDLELIKEHLAYAVRTARLPVLEIGGHPGELLRQWPPPLENAPQDPLQLLFFNLTDYLASRGWIQPLVFTPGPIPERAQWGPYRADLARIGRADERVSRLISGPLHPDLERYADIWAVPPDTPGAALLLLQRGLSLTRFGRVALEGVEGTPGAPAAGGAVITEPGDALDGCEYTVWRVAGSKAEIEFTLRDLVHLEQLALVLPPDAPAVKARVWTAYHPDSFSEATIRWTTSAVLSEGEGEIQLGQFRHPRDCRAIRMELEGAGVSELRLAEILLNQDGRTLNNLSIEPVSPWLDLRTTPSGWLESDPTGSALRMLPWYAWQRNMKGILAPVVGGGQDGLFHAGELGLRPTRRMLHLLDGMEDYEYLLYYWRAVTKGEMTLPPSAPPGRIGLPGPRGTTKQLEETMGLLAADRLRMGRHLSGKPVVTKNFGP